MKNRYLSYVVIAICTTTGLLAQKPSPSPATIQPRHFGAWGVDLTGMDRSVNPGDDFDRYVNG